MSLESVFNELVFKRYKLKIFSQMDIQTKGLDLIESLDLLEQARKKEDVKAVKECLGAVLLNDKILRVLFDVDFEGDGEYYNDSETNISDIAKGIRKCDVNVLYHINNKITDIYYDILDNEILLLDGRDDLLMNAIESEFDRTWFKYGWRFENTSKRKVKGR